MCTVRDMKPQPAKPSKPVKPLLGENISRIVRILLARDELRQQDLAEALGYESGTITRKMKGEREWRVNDLVLLAEFFEVPVSLFFEEPDTLIRNKCFRPALMAV